MNAARLGRLLLRAAATFLLIVVAAVAALHIPAVQRWLIARLLLIEGPVRVSIEHAEFHLLKRTASARGILIRATEDDPAFLSVRRLDVSWSYRRLREKLGALTVRASGVTLDLVRLPDGRLNLPEAEGGGTPLAPPRFAQVDDFYILYSDSAAAACVGPLRARIANGTLMVFQDAPGHVDAAGYAATIEELSLTGMIRTLSLEGVQAAGTLAVRTSPLPEVGRLDLHTWISLDGESKHLGLSQIDARAGEYRASGDAVFSLDEGASRAAVQASGAGAQARAELVWTGFDVANATGAANVSVARSDVRGQVGVRLGETSIQATASRIEAFGATLAANVSLDRRSGALAGSVTGNYPALDGSVDLRADLRGTAANPQASIRAQSGELQLEGFRGIRAFAEADANLERIQIHQAVAMWEGQAASATGTVYLQPSPVLDVRVETDPFRLAPILDALGVAVAADGRVSLEAHLTGAAANPEVDARISGDDLLVYGEKLGALRGEIRYRDSFAELPEIRLIKPQESGTGELRLEGWADLHDEVFSLRAASAGLKLESLTLPGATPIGGRLFVNAALHGEFEDPRGEAAVDLDGASIGELHATMRLEDRQATLALDAPRVVLDSFGVPGEVQLTAVATAPPGEWEKAEAAASISRLDLTVADFRIINDGPVDLEARGGLLHATRVRLQSGDAKLQITGAIGLDRPRGATLQVNGDVPLVLAQRYAPADYPIEISGFATVAGIIGGSVTEPDPNLEIATDGACLMLPDVTAAFSPITLRARLRRDHVQLESMDVSFSGGSIRATGRYDFAREVAGAHVEIRQVELKPLLGDSVPATLGFPLSATIDAQAAGFDIEDISARAVIEELAVLAPQGELRQTQPTNLTLAKGKLTLERLEAAGKLSKLMVQGSVNLLDETVTARGEATLDLGLVTSSSEGVAVAGQAQAGVVVRGTIRDPIIAGGLVWRDGRLALTDPLIGGEDLDLRAQVQGKKVVIDNFSGLLNGGRVRASGSFSINDGRPENVDLSLTGRNVFLDYPRGLQTVSGARLTLKSSGRNLLLGGTLTIQDGSYREGFDIATILRQARRAPASMLRERNELLESLRFNVAIRTEQPLVVDNNLGRISTAANLRLVGSPQRPGLTGRLEIEENSRVYFGGRTFEVQQGTIDFTEENRIAPVFNVAADTRISSYDITMRVSGDLDNVTTAFSSEPAADQDQILSLLLTGTVDNAGRTAAYAQTQMLTLFGSSLTGGISTQLRNTIGLSEFRIDPGLISPDSDPTARLTLAQDFTPEFRLTYSTNLSDSQDQIWAAEYNWRRRFQARFFRQTDQSNRFEVRRRFRFGGGPQSGEFTSREARPKDTFGSIEIQGESVLDEKTILRKLRIKPGGKFDTIRLQDGLRRLREYYASLGYAEVRIRQDRRVRGLNPDDAGPIPVGQRMDRREPRVYDLTLTIEAGSPVRFVFEGAPVSKRRQNRVAALWQQGLIDQQRIRTTALSLRDYFVDKGYVDAVVNAEIKQGGDAKTVVYEIDRGDKYGHPQFEFEGVTEAKAKELRTALRRERLDRQLKSRPSAIRDFLERYLVQEGFLAAEVDEFEVESPAEGKLQARIPIRKGPEFVLGDVKFRGVESLPEELLRRAMILEPGDKFVPEEHYTIAGRVQRAYWNAGFRNAEVDVEETLDRERGRADITVVVNEKQKLVVDNIEITGLDSTSEAFVRRRLRLQEGDVLAANKVNQSRRNMVDAGAYNLIDFTYPPSGPVVSPPQPQPVTLEIAVREPKPYRWDVGATWDSQRGPGIISDISTLNKLGEARVLGLRTLVDAKRQEYRVFFTQPFLGTKRINTTSTVFARTEKDLGAFDSNDVGFTVQQFVRFGPRFDFIYGFRYELAEATVRETRAYFRSTTAPFNTALVRDSRDNVLDATRGSFLSISYEYAPGLFGSNLSFDRTFVQGFKYFGLTRPVQMPFEGELRRSRVVYATGIRYGAATTSRPDEFLLPINRFFGGGGTTVRGFPNNSLGPTIGGEAIGGMGTLVLNNEIRFPLWKFVDGVGFFDAGNVWERANQISFGDLRAGTGFGLRIRNPFVVLRLDYGFKVGRRPGESMGAFFFSIGQAF
jgi:outer membrane protein assembly complex protein YaeT